MALDYIVHYSCKPKSALGEGDALRGTQVIVDLQKARSRAQAIAAATSSKGQDPKTASITVRETSADGGGVERQVSYLDLVQQGKRLKPYESECADCPANVPNEPFGCYGVVNYPIPLRSEEWLMSRVQPIDSFGGSFCLKAIKDSNLTGDLIERFRVAGLFESRQPVIKVMKKGWLSSVTVTSDQIFQAIVADSSLQPIRSFGPLVWLGAIKLDGQLLSTTEQAQAIVGLQPQDRLNRTTFDVGPRSADREIFALQDLMKALYFSFVHDVPLLLSA